MEASTPALADQIRYVYDEAGRLVQATSSDGSGTAYRYDEIGNILSVKRIVAGNVVISEFSPNSGSSGVQVLIYGSGFDEVATNNVVAFNGTSAVVQNATKTVLTVAVPSNATTGKISVTNSNGTATSNSDFVIATANAPSITSFSPAMGPAGTAITITGTNFGAQPATNKVKIGEYAASASSANVSQVIASAPTISASGKISVTTAFGKAVSGSDFFALPPGVSAVDVGHTGRIVAGGSAQTVQIGAAGKKALVLFDGIAGDRYWLAFSGSTLYSANVKVMSPDGVTITNFTINLTAMNYDIPALPTTGTFLIFIEPTSTVTGKVDVQINQVARDITGPIEINGSALPLSLDIRQRAMLAFNGTAGQRLGLGYVNFTSDPAFQVTSYTVFKPDGSQLLSSAWSNSNSNSNNLSPLPVSGTYKIQVKSLAFAKTSLSLLLSEDVAATLMPDAAPLNVNIARVGQNARLTFDAAAGKHYWLKLRGGTFPSLFTAYIYNPDGSTLDTTSVSTSQDVDLGVLKASGTYVVWFDPTSTNTGKIDVELVTIPDDFVTPIEINGAAVPISLSARQRAMLTFNGTAGQRLGIGYANVTTNPTSQSVSYTVFKPDGTQLFYDSRSGSNSNNLPALPVSGTYTIQVKSTTFATTSLSLLLSDEVTGTLISDAAPLNVNMARVGQDARLAFDAVAGQHFWLKLRGGTFPGAVTVYIYKPDGSTLNTTSVATSKDFDMGVLPASGTYVVWFDTSPTNTGKVEVELVTIPADSVSTIMVDGGAASLNLAAGQRAVLSFDGVAGQRLGLGYTGVSTIPASSNIFYTFNKPDGTQLFSNYSTSNNSADLPALPISGTYTVVVKADNFARAATNVWLSSDVAVTLVRNDPAITVPINRVGQNARLTFNGVAGQAYTLRFTAGTFPSTVSVTVFSPSGSSLTSTSVSSSGNLTLSALAATGTYTIVIAPSGTTTGQVNAQLQ